MTPEEITEIAEVSGFRASLADRLLDQIRHVQHHVGSMHTQLRHVGSMHTQLRRKVGKDPKLLGLGV